MWRIILVVVAFAIFIGVLVFVCERYCPSEDEETRLRDEFTRVSREMGWETALARDLP